MISEKSYKKLTAKFWIGKKVRTLVDLSNGWCSIAKGTILEITGKGGGFSLKSSPCHSCKVRISIAKVQPYDVEQIETGGRNILISQKPSRKEIENAIQILQSHIISEHAKGSTCITTALCIRLKEAN